MLIISKPDIMASPRGPLSCGLVISSRGGLLGALTDPKAGPSLTKGVITAKGGHLARLARDADTTQKAAKPVCTSGGDRVYPNICNYCVQLSPKLQRCVSHVYPNFFLHLQSYVLTSAVLRSPAALPQTR